MTRQIKGWHVLTGFGVAFGVIIAVNLTLAYQAVATFPGLEVKNSYVASQSFDVDRAAQEATHDTLRLFIRHAGQPIAPHVEEATFGRATNVAADQRPAFVFDGTAYVAPVVAGPGNWNLRIKLRAPDGTLFQQRVIVAHVAS